MKSPLPVIHNPNVRKEPVIADSVALKKKKSLGASEEVPLPISTTKGCIGSQ